MYHMKKASIRDLRYNFKKVERLLKAGEEIEVTKRNKVIARLVPICERCREMPDFMGRMRAMFGDKMFEPSNAELLAEDRDRY
jgi:antitoxin (DNA-binding transcriptional repressor) of toxin-antitoxin stability system